MVPIASYRSSRFLETHYDVLKYSSPFVGGSKSTSVILRIEGWTNTIFEGIIIAKTWMWLQLRVKIIMRWDEQRRKSSFSSHLYQLVPVHWTTRRAFFSLSMGMIRYFSLRKMANPLLGIVIIHSLLHLMISSSIPSPAFGVYSSISISLQLGDANKKSNKMMKSLLLSMLLMPTRS